jgi:hypothetical protein
LATLCSSVISVNDTVNKLLTGVNDTSDKFIAGVVDTGEHTSGFSLIYIASAPATNFLYVREVFKNLRWTFAEYV